MVVDEETGVVDEAREEEFGIKGDGVVVGCC